jgi:NADPH:quinone reductase-like Zn-dependent oxidoreductase
MGQMRAVRIHDFGGSDVLQLENIERPEADADEVLIEIHAASVNTVDYKTRSGAFPAVTREQLPVTLGRDVSGMIVQCGRAVESLHLGEEVYALLDRDHGSYAEYVVAPAAICALKPQTLDHITAASVPLAGLTAWQGLFDHGRLQAGETVLVHGGAGGVGHLAVQLAKAKGARVAATVSHADIELMQALGVDEIIDYKALRFEDVVHDVDLVFDLIGGETQRRSWSVLKPGGRLVSTHGQPSASEARAHHVVAAGYMAQPNAAQLAEIAALIDQDRVRPLVRASFGLEQARTAQERAEHDHALGKVVLRVVTPADA